MQIINTIHRYLGELMLLIALIGVILAIVGLVRKKAWNRPEDLFGMVFAGLLDLQALLGIISWVYILVNVGRILSLAYILHPLFMIAAVVVVHASRKWRTMPVPVRHRAQLIAYGLSLVLIFVGRMIYSWA
jgi:hypothetical protein